MTNAELIQAIKNEIERLYDGEAPKHDQQCDFDDGYFTGIDAISKFLDTLESEKPVSKDLESYAQKVEDYYDVGEERGYLYTHRGDIKNAVLAGAKWQKEQMMDEWLKDRSGCFWDGVEEGKKAMEKEAVEGEVVKDINNKLAVTAKNVNLDKFKFGDKVKIIIVKED